MLASLRVHAPGLQGCRILVVADGFDVRSESAWKKGQVSLEVAAAYGTYLDRLAALSVPGASPLWDCVQLVVLAVRHGCAHALRRSLALVETPFVLSAQHDRPFLRPVDAAAMLAALQALPANAVWWPTSCTADYARRKEGRYAAALKGQLQAATVCSAGLHLVPMIQHLDSTHVARVAWYQRDVFGRRRRANIPRGGFVEDCLGPVQLRAILSGGMAAHREFGTFLLVAEPCVGHLNGHDRMAGSAAWCKWALAAHHTDWEAVAEQGLGLNHEQPAGHALVLEGFGLDGETERMRRSGQTRNKHSAEAVRVDDEEAAEDVEAADAHPAAV